MTDAVKDRPALKALRSVLDERVGIYKELAEVTDFGSYLAHAVA